MSTLSWTGNPIVDTGLAVAVVRAGKKSPDEMTIVDFQNVIGDGQWLYHANSCLNAYVALFANGLLNRSNVKAMQDGSEEKKYKRILTELKDYLGNTSTEDQPVCECTGEFPAANQFMNQLTLRLRQDGILNDGQRLDIGRNAFPLLGSIGNDAGALPGASREPRISAFALLCAQLTPLAAVMMKGKVAFFQYTAPQLLIQHVRNVYEDTWGRVSVAPSRSKIEGYGTGGGTTQTSRLLLKEFIDLQSGLRIGKLPKNVALNLWLIVNSGTSYDSDLLEIPNNSLQFLWLLAKDHYKEIDMLLKRESKSWSTQLLMCLTQKLDYELLYPGKGNHPASKDLFSLYQTSVFGRPAVSLQVAEWIANHLKSRAKDKNDKKELEELTKYLVDSRDSKQLRPRLRRIFASMAEEGLFSYDEYSALFPIEQGRPLRVSKFGWKYIWFYLNHDDLKSERPQFSTEDSMEINKQFREIIRRYARDVFDYYVDKHGAEKFQKRILDGFRNNKIRIDELRRWFINLGESKPGYTNEDWDWLCRDETGVNRIGELIFQLRLELANLYRTHVSGSTT